ncbi:MAG: helicase-related protein [Verrucomicrobiota bacterium]
MTADLPRVKITDPPVPLPVGIVLPPLVRTPGNRASREVRIPLYFDNAFRVMWKSYKLAFHQRGYCIRQHNGAWWLQQWLLGFPGNWTLTAVGAEQLAALAAPRKPAAAPMEIPAEFILPELPDGLEKKLFEYQWQPARQLYRALCCGREEWGFPGAWDCSDLGTGKTYQSLAAALATGLEVGVVCPKAVIGSAKGKSGWLGAFAHFGQIPKFVMNYESLRTGGREVVKKTGNSGRPFEWTVDPDHVMIIWDEAHNLKNPSLNRSMAQAAIRQGFKQLFVSGTMAAKPTNLAATGVAVGLHRGDRESYSQFLKTHGCYQVGDAWEFDRYRGTHHLARINSVVFPRRGARVKISDLGDRFPETQILCESIETEDTKAIVKAYAEAEALIQTLRAQGKGEGEILNAQRAAYMAVRKKSEIAKVPALVAMAQAEIAEGRSVAIFLNFTEARERIMRELKTTCGIFGGQDSRQRDEAMRKFQADESRVIVVMSAAGGTGVSLHDVRGEHPRTALICPDNNAVTLGQVLGRVHRAGGKSRSRQLIVYAAGTVEEAICDNVRQKLSAIQTVNDGDLNPADKF